MTREQVIDRINKLFALAGNNPSQAEAEAAMAKAQELLAEHKISLTEIPGENQEVEIVIHKMTDYSGKISSHWKWTLGNIIAKNFACRFLAFGNYATFMGTETDAIVALATWKFALAQVDRGTKKIRKEYRKIGMDRTGASGAYINGFLSGIRERLNQQLANRYALVMAVPTEAIENSLGKKLSDLKQAKPRKTKASADSYAFGKGYQDGLTTDSKQLNKAL